MMLLLIDAQRESYGVESICSMPSIAPSTYYELKARQQDLMLLPEQLKRDAELHEQIERVWHRNFKVYGGRKI